MNENETVLTEKEAAKFLRIAAQSLRLQRCKGERVGGLPMIPWMKLGRSVRYLKSDLLATMEQARVGASNET